MLRTVTYKKSSYIEKTHSTPNVANRIVGDKMRIYCLYPASLSIQNTDRVRIMIEISAEIRLSVYTLEQKASIFVLSSLYFTPSLIAYVAMPRPASRIKYPI